MFWLFAHRCLRGVSLRPRALFIAFSRGHQGAIIREALDGSVNIKPHTLFSHSTQHCISTGADGSCRYICELHTHTPLIHGCSRPAHTPAPPFLAFSMRSNAAYRARLIQCTSSYMLFLSPTVEPPRRSGEVPCFILKLLLNLHAESCIRKRTVRCDVEPCTKNLISFHHQKNSNESEPV